MLDSGKYPQSTHCRTITQFLAAVVPDLDDTHFHKHNERKQQQRKTKPNPIEEHPQTSKLRDPYPPLKPLGMRINLPAAAPNPEIQKATAIPATAALRSAPHPNLLPRLDVDRRHRPRNQSLKRIRDASLWSLRLQSRAGVCRTTPLVGR